MKLFKLAAIVAGAGIAQVIAVPLVVLPPPTNTPTAHIRFGFAVPQRTDRPGIGIGEPRMRAPCGRHRPSRFHQKAVEISNIFRQVLGLPLIQAGGPPGHPGHHDIRPIYPVVATFAPVIYDNKGVKVYDMGIEGGGVKVNDAPDVSHHAHPQPGYNYVHTHHRHPHNHHQLGKGPFIQRIHYSLMNLGRWEGRAVAFVLGCGIGVLLRMIWVLTVVMYRAVRGQRSDEHEYSQITIIEEIVDTPKSTPPTYTYPVDEKVAIPVVIVQPPSTAEESK